MVERWREFRRGQERADLALARVRAETARLTPGLYVPAGPALWRRLGTALPMHLRRTKAEDVRGLRRRVLDGVRGVFRPRFFGVTRARGWRPGYPIAVATYEGGVVLLDPDGGTVARVRDDPAPGTDVLRERLGRHVATPGFRSEEGGRFVVEEFIVGEPVPDHPAEAREHVIRALCGAWARLTAAEAEQTWDALLDRTFHACVGLDLPVEIRRVIDAGVPANAHGWPLVPAATDAMLRNVVLRYDVPVLIDLGDVRWEPFMSYPLGTVVDGGPQVLRRYVDGQLDDALHALATAGGVMWPPSPWSRLDLLAVRTCVVTVQAVGTGPDLQAGITRRWRPVAQALDGR